MPDHDRFVPALGYFSLAPLYDPLIKLFMREGRLKSQLISNARIGPTSTVLDLGCGTATLAMMMKQAHPDANVVGLDGDENILRIARKKIARSRLDITLDKAMSFDMPYPQETFDRVVTSLMLHHLSTENKARTLKEVFRVLVPGGEFHIADFTAPHGGFAHLASHQSGRSESVPGNLMGQLPLMMMDAGFLSVEPRGDFATLLGTVGLLSAAKPG